MMKMSVCTSALVLPLISLGLILGARASAQLPLTESQIGTQVSGGQAKASPTQLATPFSSKEGRFSITLPPRFPTFKYNRQTQSTDVGNIELHIYSSEAASGACFLGYSDFPAVSFEGRSAQQTLEAGRDGALTNVKGTLEKQESLTVQGYPAINVYATASSGTQTIYARFEFILVKPRAYQIIYLAYDRASLDKPETQAYFKSFHLAD